MSRDKIKIYGLEIILLLISFFALFIPSVINKITLSIILSIYAVFVYKFLRKRNILSTNTRQVIILMAMLGFIYIGILYLLGIYFGFYEATIPFGRWVLLHYIIPYTLIIVASEVIRETFLAQKTTFSIVLTFLSMLLIDIILFAGIYDLSKLDDFLTVIGLIIFSGISCNLFYNYVSTRYGKMPLIIYRLVTTLYVYIIPITPDLYMFFRTFIRLIYPYLLYFLLEYTYAKAEMVTSYNAKWRNRIASTVLIVVLATFAMLISCRFKTGMLVVGSGSMTGTINKGDAVVFTRVDDTDIKVEDVIVFAKDNINVVHRIVDIKNVNGEYRYYTKGDANQNVDDGYILRNQILGKVDFKIKYIGYPTLWIRDIFSI